MAVFVLWNVNRRPALDGLVQSLVRQIRADVVLLVEYAVGTSQLPKMLRSEGLIKRPSPDRFGVFTPESHGLVQLRYSLGRRAAMWKWTPPSQDEGTIVLLHGLDRRNYDDSARRVQFGRIADAVRRREAKCRHQRTIIAGDFNAHPFESPIVDVDGLHACGVHAPPRRKFLRAGAADRPADFFYNPTWRAYGHEQHADAGAATYYWPNASASRLGWYMLDQVVIRPVETPRFPEDQVQIVCRIGGISLLTSAGFPDSQTASDHLPLSFQWNL